jgi:hypothetical protein
MEPRRRSAATQAHPPFKEPIMNSIPPRAARIWRRAIACLAFAVTALGCGLARADPVVVGSVEPQSMRVTIFEDLLVKRFADGSAISRLYGKYDAVSKGFQFLRAGKLANGACRTEVFDLVRLPGNRLAIASPTDARIAWEPRLIPQKMFATFDCTSYDCMSCDSANAFDDPQGTGNNGPYHPGNGSYCVCRDSSGVCNTVRPGTAGPYGAGDLVVLGN